MRVREHQLCFDPSTSCRAGRPLYQSVARPTDSLTDQRRHHPDATRSCSHVPVLINH
jgi:hypothetical protein